MKLEFTGTMSDGSPIPNNLLAKAQYSIADPSIASIINGEVIPKKNGHTTIKVTIDGVSGTFDIDITDIINFDRLAINPKAVSLPIGTIMIINVG